MGFTLMKKLVIYLIIIFTIYAPVELSRCILEYNYPFGWNDRGELLIIWVAYGIAIYILTKELRKEGNP